VEKKRILIVDDEELVRKLLFDIFERFSCEVETAANGVEAIEQIAVKSYDLIVTDYMMPKMDGLELTRKIKTISPSLPILIITGNGPEQELLKNGAAACIKKPFSISEIKRISQNILEG
jgi:CheY-like chemotaxis protein